MFRHRWMFLTTLLLVASCTPEKSQEPAYYDSLRLVSAMREDELLLLAVRSAKSASNRLSEEDAACLDQLEFPEVTDLPARQISDHMTATEVNDALGYFHSGSGRKYVRRTQLALTGKLADAPELSAAEQTELEQFKQRPAGRKLLQDRITTPPALMEEATVRVDRHLEDCAYGRENDAQRLSSKKSCKSPPIASVDHVCLANYADEGVGPARQLKVEVECRHHGRTLTSRMELLPEDLPIALRWSQSRELEILIKNAGRKIIASDDGYSAQRFRIASWQRGDPPPVVCLPQSTQRWIFASTFPLSTAIGAWRAHHRPGVCMMTARIPKEEVPGAEGDVLLQFRRHKATVLPFATTDLAFIVQIAQSNQEKPVFVNSGDSRLAMIQLGSQSMHMVAGKAAEALLQGLTSKPAELTVAPEGTASYTVPVRQQDFDFAHSDFSECLSRLSGSL